MNTSNINFAKCQHDWEEHGCTDPILKYYICKKCKADKTISSSVHNTHSVPEKSVQEASP